MADGRVAVTDLDSVHLIGAAGWIESLPTPPPPPKDPGQVERVGDWVIINGVRVPVRKQGM
jgi:hypothetical protein